MSIVKTKPFIRVSPEFLGNANFVLIPVHVRNLVCEQVARADIMHRRDLILAAANKDGGAHVDKTLDPIYDKARLGAGMELEFVMKGGLPKRTASFDNVHYASLRQVAYEVLNSPAIQNLAS